MIINTQYIPDLIAAVVSRVDNTFATRPADKDPFNVYFDYGHYTEIVRNLTQKEGSISKPPKYPLVWLVMDFEESVTSNLSIYCEINMQLIIAMDTTASKTMEERKNDVFLKRLYPIYAELLKQFGQDVHFATLGNIPHVKIDRPYWGGQDSMGNGQANLFNDWIDAIQIKNLKILVKKKQIQKQLIK